MGDEKDITPTDATRPETSLDDGGADGGMLDPQALGAGDEAATIAETGPGAGGD